MKRFFFKAILLVLNHFANGAKKRPSVNLRSTYSVDLTVTLGQGFDSIPEKKERQQTKVDKIRGILGYSLSFKMTLLIGPESPFSRVECRKLVPPCLRGTKSSHHQRNAPLFK